MKKNIFLGTIKSKESQKGNSYYKGFVCNVPVVGFVKTAEDGTEQISFSLDVSTASWIVEQEVDENDKGGKSDRSAGKVAKKQEKPASPVTDEDDDDDVPF